MLLIPLILLLLHRTTDRPGDHATDRTAGQARGDSTGANPEHANPQPGAGQTPLGLPAQEKPVPAYVPIGDARIPRLDRSAEYLLTGKVTSEQGDGLPGATVSLHSSMGTPPAYEWPPAVLSRVTDNAGQYTLRLNSPMRAFIVVRKEGYTQKDGVINFVEPGTIVRNHSLRPAPACVEGYIFDKGRKPIAGAAVTTAISQITTSGADSVFSSTTRITGASGKYLIDALPEGSLGISASSPRHLLEGENVELKAGVACLRLDFNLGEARLFSIMVRNSRGEALANPRATSPGPMGSVLSDEPGVLRFALPPETGPFKSTVSATGYKPKIILLDLSAPPAEVILEEGEVVIGRVVTESGEPIEGARVSVTGVDRGSFGSAETDNVGRFSVVLPSLPVGRIRVVKDGFNEQSIVYSDTQPVPADLVIRLQRSNGGIYGRVIDDAFKPIRRFQIFLQDASAETGGPRYSRDFAGDQGLFSLGDIPEGIYSLTVRSLPHTPTESIQSLRLERVEIRRGYFLGEFLIQFPPRNQI